MGDQDLISEMEQVFDQQSCFLSDDLIIEEILTRLPVKSILRFKSVSKQWYSTLSSSDFANAHLIKSPFSHPSTPVNTLFIQSGSNCFVFSYNDDQISGNFQDDLVNLDPSEFWVQEDYLVLTGCCNGLICFTPLYNTYLYFIIWNPATRKMHKYESDYRNTLPFFYGFGYVSSVDDYKYVRVSFRKGLGSGKSNHIVHIFSLKENKWKRLYFDAHGVVFIFGEPVLINEILYWRACFPGADDSLLSFDLGVEMFDTVNLDHGDILGVMGGCLSKCKSSDANTGEMLMHIFESTGAMVTSIGVPEGLGLNLGSQMIGFTRTGKIFVTGPLTDEIWDSQCRRLGIVDTATKPMQYTTLLKFDEKIYIARYVPSLVSPFPGEELSRA